MKSIIAILAVLTAVSSFAATQFTLTLTGTRIAKVAVQGCGAPVYLTAAKKSMTFSLGQCKTRDIGLAYFDAKGAALQSGEIVFDITNASQKSDFPVEVTTGGANITFNDVNSGFRASLNSSTKKVTEHYNLKDNMTFTIQ